MTNIYSLKEAGTGIVEYVGRTEFSLAIRLKEHIRETLGGGQSPKNQWIADVLRRGGTVDIELIGSCNSSNRKETEEYWIRHYKSINPYLKNGTPSSDDDAENGCVSSVEEVNSYQTIKIRESSMSNLRKIYAITGERNVSILERLVKEELESLANHTG
jgi:hypothetical protein